MGAAIQLATRHKRLSAAMNDTKSANAGHGLPLPGPADSVSTRNLTPYCVLTEKPTAPAPPRERRRETGGACGRSARRTPVAGLRIASGRSLITAWSVENWEFGRRLVLPRREAVSASRPAARLRPSSRMRQFFVTFSRNVARGDAVCDDDARGRPVPNAHWVGRFIWIAGVPTPQSATPSYLAFLGRISPE